MDHIFIHSSADGHPSCVHILAVVNSASVNKGVPGFPLKASPPQSSSLPGPAPPLPAAEDSSPGMSGWAQIVRVTLHSDYHGPTLHSLTASKSFLTQQIAPQEGTLPCISPPPSGCGVQSHSLSSVVPLGSSCQDLHGSIYSFPAVGDSCQYSAGFLRDLLCLKMCSWGIRE